MTTQDFIRWITGYRSCNKIEAIKIASDQLGVATTEIKEWLKGEIPGKTAQILMKLIVQRKSPNYPSTLI